MKTTWSAISSLGTSWQRMSYVECQPIAGLEQADMTGEWLDFGRLPRTADIQRASASPDSDRFFPPQPIFINSHPAHLPRLTSSGPTVGLRSSPSSISGPVTANRQMLSTKTTCRTGQMPVVLVDNSERSRLTACSRWQAVIIPENWGLTSGGGLASVINFPFLLLPPPTQALSYSLRFLSSGLALVYYT